MPWFDAHLDLACLALCGRDMLAEPARAGGPWQPAGLTLRSLREGRVVACMGTIFTEVGGEDEPISYPAGDADAARRAGVRQLGVYRDWADKGLISIVSGGVSGAAFPPRRVSPVHVPPEQETENSGPRDPRLSLLILMEGADPIRDPDDLAWWTERGVRAVGLAWARGSRYAGGNTEQRGLTRLGRELLRELDRLGVVHDLSHLSDAACDELLSHTDARVMASHSNCRAITDPSNARHLTDGVIREIARRGGVIGMNLYSKFLRRGAGEHDRAALRDVVAHADRIAGLVGHARCIGLGSDMDGGFSAAALPRGIDSPRDYPLIAQALRGAGWSEADAGAFEWENWARFWRLEPHGGKNLGDRGGRGEERGEARRG